MVDEHDQTRLLMSTQLVFLVRILFQKMVPCFHDFTFKYLIRVFDSTTYSFSNNVLLNIMDS